TLYASDYEHESCGVGFVAQIDGVPSHAIVADACSILARMEHRGACGCEAETGDGAGILTGVPHKLVKKIGKAVGFRTDYPFIGVGNVFLPLDEAELEKCQILFAQNANRFGQKLIGWRVVPVDPEGAGIGVSALRTQPKIMQVFIGAKEGLSQDQFERQLYLIRKSTTHAIQKARVSSTGRFYVCSLSSRIIVYKGMLSTAQLPMYFADLRDKDYESHLAMVHSRFSTNTLPNWSRAQPLRWMAHNGEINTLRGNRNWITARQGLMKSELFGRDLRSVMPVIESGCSDSGEFDNAMEMLMMSGRELPEVVMMMIPEAWRNHELMPENKRAFYEYHSCLQEPWDGPASISFTDGRMIGAVLDRNGLRPSRYYVLNDNRVVMASEVGVLDVDPDQVVKKGRLEPGKMFLVDFENKRIVADHELKDGIANRLPYSQWVANQRITFDELPKHELTPFLPTDERVAQMRAFGYTNETLDFMLLPLVKVEKDPILSMGNDAALACLSDKPRLLYDYFAQLFAQVTNPPIDSIREEIVMSVECYIGPEGNLLETTEEQCNRLLLPNPILDFEQMSSIHNLDHRGWKSKLIDITFDKAAGQEGFMDALRRIRREAKAAIDENCAILVLSDRAISTERVPLSALLATSTVHHFLVENELRTRIGIIVETGEAREVHHHCLLTGFGADGIHPYLGLEAIIDHHANNPDSKLTAAQCIASYRKGVSKGMLKVLAKMGISTLASYKGARIFEAVGLNSNVIETCFPGTASRIQGVGFDVLANEAIRRHDLGFAQETKPADSLPLIQLDTAGSIHWRSGGEKHAWTPLNIANIQQAARAGDPDAYQRFSKAINEQTARECHLRGLLRFRPRTSIPIQQVESAKEIVKRFCTGAMSFGSISAEAHETLAVAMNRLGGKSNTGEGGEDYRRFTPDDNGDLRRSAIKQVASGRFGVTAYYLANADEIQIKMAQGAKPGEGGELPGHKVDETIAKTRRSTPGVTLISPPPHHDIYSIEDLAQLIFDLKNANPTARISVKLVSEVGVGTIAAGVAKAHADNILISGTGGGTGASPLTSIKHAGMPWELGIAETHQTLVMNDLRSRVRLQTDGQLKTGRDVVIATLLGAEEYGFATAPLITLGCIMMRKCHLNTCPVGIATQDKTLRKKFAGKPEHVVNYLFMVAEEARQIMAELGFRSINEMVGRVDALDVDDAVEHWKAKGIDLSKLLAPAVGFYDGIQVYCTIDQDHALENVLDWKLLEESEPAISVEKKVHIETEIKNTDRAVGAILSHHVVKKHGPDGFSKNTIWISCKGSAGQSLGAFLAGGITIQVEGDANDYTGKGLSGGRLIVFPPKESKFASEDNIIIGNVALYGATGGEAYFRGVAAERFAVRNSGALAVVEGVGDHGCEYMTGGRVVILGPIGRNFAAGMSGGIAYVYDPNDTILTNINLDLVDIESMDQESDIEELRDLIANHANLTGSVVAQNILDDWESSLLKFKKIIPELYRDILMTKQTKSTAS
ncbi:MAG: glutamate synthase large subunit, partial [Mariniblastus sp.]|nr:glutamate synthase large subunit [Mariniblastus sp.]